MWTHGVGRYTPMSYYRQLMRSIYDAWDGSRLLQERYPKIRFHVHSESTDFPPPYGDATTLPEFEVGFPRLVDGSGNLCCGVHIDEASIFSF